MIKNILMVGLATASLSGLAAPQENIEKASTAASISSKGHKSEQLITDVDAGNFRLTRKSLEKKSRTTNLIEKQKKPQQYRDSKVQVSSQNFGFSIYEAYSTLDYDFDGDGYYSEFTINIDADYDYGHADVYAKLYLSKQGGPWVLYDTTNAFSIDGNISSDSYNVSTLLNYDFPTDSYDVLIDLYEVGVDGVVATVSANDFSSLGYLPLEDDEHEQNSNDTLITYVATQLSADLDHDGYYTQVSLEYDIDTLEPGQLVYAQLELINVDTFNRRVFSTESFVLGNQTEVIDLFLESGYVAGDYDIVIKLKDYYNGEIKANAAQDFSALSQLALESEEYDYVHVPPVEHHESGGGAISWIWASLLLLLRNRAKH